jgi:serine phosphatase RsbU (regulator of sigma subunit)
MTEGTLPPDSDGTVVAHRDAGEPPEDRVHHLVVVEGETPGQRFELRGNQPLLLGRGAECQVRLRDPEVSKQHCRLVRTTHMVLVADLGSTNGTFVDGIRVKQGSLRAESLLRVGQHVLRYEYRSRAELERSEEQAADLRRAREYVEALIPEPILEGPIQVDWCFVPSAVLGGDAFGYHDLADGRFALYLLDVCGHGAAAAMHSAAALNVLRSSSLPEVDFSDPGRVLTVMNQKFAMESHGGMFLTLWYGVFDPGARKLCFSSAGHPPPLLGSPEGCGLRRLEVRNPPIGAWEGREFELSETSVEPGERLYLYSDGVFEVRGQDGAPRGLADFERSLASQHQQGAPSARDLYQQAVIESPGALEDDFSLVVAIFT